MDDNIGDNAPANVNVRTSLVHREKISHILPSLCPSRSASLHASGREASLLVLGVVGVERLVMHMTGW